MEGVSKKDVLTFLLPKVPLLLRVALTHVLRLSESSRRVDFTTELVVAMVRSEVASFKYTMTQIQKFTAREIGANGPIWLSKYLCPLPKESNVREVLSDVLDAMKPTDMTHNIQVPDVVPVEAEWTGYRRNVAPDDPLPNISEQERYNIMEKECSSCTTIMYFHGGAYYMLDPVGYRDLVRRLAKASGGRCYSVRYRLAPKHSFPAAILDAIVSYLNLLYPAPGAFHGPIPAESIVLSGDSAGGNLALTLMRFLLELKRMNKKIHWLGEDREVPLPAGMALLSPWVDILHATPSIARNANFDYLPISMMQNGYDFPTCELWPPTKPRFCPYVENELIMHPMVSLALSDGWEGAPPVYICSGWEQLLDEQRLMAAKLHRAGVKIVFEEYEGMAHVFSVLFPNAAATKKCRQSLATFAKTAVESPESIESHAVSINATNLKETALNLETLETISEEELAIGMADKFKLLAKL